MERNKQTRIMDASVEEFYREMDQRLRRVKHMNLARWKLVQNTTISILVAYLALETGADATVAVAVIALINGISIADLATIWGDRRPPVDESQIETETNADDDR